MGLKKAILGAASVVAMAFASSQAGQAADVGISRAPPNAWTGPRVGIVGGYGWGKAEHKGTGQLSEDESGSVDLKGAMIGGLIGYDYGLSNGLVLGVVGDLSWLGLDGKDCLGFVGCGDELHTKIDMLGTLRGRAGFGIDDVLIYGTGGLAFGNVDVSMDGAGGSDTQMMLGWAAGGGIEYRISDPVSIGLEYLYIDLGKDSFDLSSGHGKTGQDVSVTSQTLRASLNFRF